MIKYCYSTAEAESVNPKTFWGELHESGRIEDADVAERLRQNEAAYGAAVRGELLETDDIIFLNMVGSGQIGFDESYIPAEVTDADKMGYLPECMLLGITVFLGTIAIAAGCVYRKRRKSEAESQNEEGDGLDWIAVDIKISWKNLRARIKRRATAAVLTVTIFLGAFLMLWVCAS